MAARSSVGRLLRCLVVTLAALCALYQVTDCVARFAAAPVSGRRDAEATSRLPPPALTLCNHVLDGPTLRDMVGNLKPIDLEDLNWSELGNGTIPDLLRRTSVGAEQALSSCQLLGQPCAAVGSWSRRLHSSTGDCFTFTPNGSEPIQVGSGFNVIFLLPSSVYSSLDNTSYALVDGYFHAVRYKEGSMKLSAYVHDANEPFTALPWIQPMEPLEVELGVQAEIRIAMEVAELLDHVHLPCKSRPGYSRVRCALACHAAAAAAATGLDCRVTDMPTDAPLCGTFANYSVVQKAFTTAAGAQLAMEQCRQRCPRPCVQRLFRAAKQPHYGRDESQLRKFMLRVYYAGQETEHYTEKWAYSVSALIGEAGGVIGLMLGLSVLSVFEAVGAVGSALLGRLNAAGARPRNTEPATQPQKKPKDDQTISMVEIV